MPRSLEYFIEPQYIKGIIKQTFYSKRGSKLVWCVVEGLDDMEIYDKFFDDDTTIKSPAQADIFGKGGYENVVKIVTEVSKEDPQCHIFGICDKDYTEYCSNYVFPNIVFLTDNRDIEIMMLNTSSVQNGLKTWNSIFPSKLSEAIEVTRYLGYLRIYNYVQDANCTFHNTIKISSIWDFNTHSLKNSWQEILLQAFISNCAECVNKEQVIQFIIDKKLESDFWQNVCRGHDVLELLQLMMVKKEYAKKNIFKKIVSDYSYEDFKVSLLCKSIKHWAIEHDVKVLKSHVV